MSNRIPFDLEKWQSGEYDVEYGDGSKPIAVYYIKEAEIWNILSISDSKTIHKHVITGNYYCNRGCALDLFLTLKKKKVFILAAVCNGEADVYTFKTLFDKEQLLMYKNELGHKIVFETEFEY